MKVLLTLLLLVTSAAAQIVPAREIRMVPGTTGAIAGRYRLVIDPVSFTLRCIGPGSTDCMPVSTGGGGGESGIFTINTLTGPVQTFAVTNDTNVNLAINSAGTVHTWVVTWSGTLAKSRQHAQTAYYDAATNTFTNGITAPTFTGGLVGNASTATALFADPNDCSAGTFATAINTLGNLSCIAVGYGTLTGVPTTFAPATHVLNSATHTVSGLTTGHFLRALSATTFGFSALLAADVPTLNQSTTGNAATATSLAADGSNCSAGSYPLGVDASGNVQNCTVAGGGGGSGTVTSFSAGDLSTLFTTSEATPTTTPALTFTATTGIAQNAVLAGPSSGGAGAYSFRALVPADIPTLNQSTTGSAGSLSAVLGCAQFPALTGAVTSSAGSCATTAASSIVQNNQANTYTAGNKQSFSSSATTAGARHVGVTADPSSPVAGDFWYRSDTALYSGYTTGVHRFAFTDSSITGNAATATALAANGSNCGAGNYPLGVDAGGNVENCTAAGGLSNPMTTAGDIIYGGASGVPTRLGIGGANTLLHGGASAPAYSAVAQGDVTNGYVDLSSTQTVNGAKTLGDKLTVDAATTAGASINIQSGTAPTTPVAGDVWLASNEEIHIPQTGTKGGVTLYDSGGTSKITLGANGAVTSYPLDFPPTAPPQNHSTIDCSTAGACVWNAERQTAMYTAADYTNATTTFSNVTGISFAVDASKNYIGRCYILWSGSAGTTGPKFQLTGPATPTAVIGSLESAVTATTSIFASVTAFSSAMANTGTVTAATNLPAFITFSVMNGTNAGTIQLQAAANGTGTLTIRKGSNCALE